MGAVLGGGGEIWSPLSSYSVLTPTQKNREKCSGREEECSVKRKNKINKNKNLCSLRCRKSSSSRQQGTEVITVLSSTSNRTMAKRQELDFRLRLTAWWENYTSCLSF